MSALEALDTLRALHKEYIRQCGKRFAAVPFSARAVPGWVYYPADDIVKAPHLSQ